MNRCSETSRSRSRDERSAEACGRITDEATIQRVPNRANHDRFLTKAILVVYEFERTILGVLDEYDSISGESSRKREMQNICAQYSGPEEVRRENFRRSADLAQLVERKALNLVVMGSSPMVGDVVLQARVTSLISQLFG